MLIQNDNLYEKKMKIVNFFSKLTNKKSAYLFMIMETTQRQLSKLNLETTMMMMMAKKNLNKDNLQSFFLLSFFGHLISQAQKKNNQPRLNVEIVES